jgi:hypothetical protein
LGVFILEFLALPFLAVVLPYLFIIPGIFAVINILYAVLELSKFAKSNPKDNDIGLWLFPNFLVIFFITAISNMLYFVNDPSASAEVVGKLQQESF